MAEEDAKTIVSRVEQLVDYYHGINTHDDLYVGIEWERSGVYCQDLSAVGYEGDRGYLAILKKLVAEVGWEIIDGHRNEIYELKRGATVVATESDGRLELAGSPQKSLHDLAREFRIHLNEVKEISDFFDIQWFSMGWHPLAKPNEIKLLEKPHYKYVFGISDNPLLEETLKLSNGVHVNLSFTDQENAIKKAQIAFRVLPIIGAIFASSPLIGGQFSGYLNYRRHVIRNYCPERCSMNEKFLDPDFTLKDWIEDSFDRPILYCKIKGEYYQPPHKMTFRDWVQKGIDGIFPTIGDFDFHVKTLWPDVRLRPSYLEFRIVDSVPYNMMMAIPALMKGILFDSNSWMAVEELTKNWTYNDIMNLDKDAWKRGLQTEFKGRSLLSYAKELVEIANSALHNFGRLNGVGSDEDETIYLVPLKEQIYIKEKGLAREILENWEGQWNRNPRRLLEWCQR